MEFYKTMFKMRNVERICKRQFENFLKRFWKRQKNCKYVQLYNSTNSKFPQIRKAGFFKMEIFLTEKIAKGKIGKCANHITTESKSNYYQVCR